MNVMMMWLCDDDMMMRWWGSMMRLYMGLGMDLLVSTFDVESGIILRRGSYFLVFHGLCMGLGMDLLVSSFDVESGIILRRGSHFLAFHGCAWVCFMCCVLCWKCGIPRFFHFPNFILFWARRHRPGHRLGHGPPHEQTCQGVGGCSGSFYIYIYIYIYVHIYIYIYNYVYTYIFFIQ